LNNSNVLILTSFTIDVVWYTDC